MNADFADGTQILQKIEDELFKKIENDPFHLRSGALWALRNLR